MNKKELYKFNARINNARQNLFANDGHTALQVFSLCQCHPEFIVWYIPIGIDNVSRQAVLRELELNYGWDYSDAQSTTIYYQLKDDGIETGILKFDTFQPSKCDVIQPRFRLLMDDYTYAVNSLMDTLPF